jgi:putative ABC transport system substrate-binding protein
MPVIGYLSGGTANESARLTDAFRRGLAEANYEEGRNVALEFRWAGGQIKPLEALAADLVRRRVAMIMATTFPAAQAAKAATSTIPIVFTSGIDPVNTGLVSSLKRPEGNLTGISTFSHELDGKRVEILRDLVPEPGAFGLLVNSASPAASIWVPAMIATAKSVGQEMQVFHANNVAEIDAAFEAMIERRIRALIIGSGALFSSQWKKIVELSARKALPAVYSGREAVIGGGLLSYDSDFAESHRQAGRYAGRILKGERPGDLPVQQPTKFYFVLNLKTAKVLGLSPSPKLLALADEVIE